MGSYLFAHQYVAVKPLQILPIQIHSWGCDLSETGDIPVLKFAVPFQIYFEDIGGGVPPSVQKCSFLHVSHNSDSLSSSGNATTMLILLSSQVALASIIPASVFSKSNSMCYMLDSLISF